MQIQKSELVEHFKKRERAIMDKVKSKMRSLSSAGRDRENALTMTIDMLSDGLIELLTAAGVPVASAEAFIPLRYQSGSDTQEEVGVSHARESNDSHSSHAKTLPQEPGRLPVTPSKVAGTRATSSSSPGTPITSPAGVGAISTPGPRPRPSRDVTSDAIADLLLMGRKALS